jgi:hypothetical protein
MIARPRGPAGDGKPDDLGPECLSHLKRAVGSPVDDDDHFFGRRLGPAEILKTLLELLAAVMDRHDDRNSHVSKRGRGLRFL